MWSRGLPSAVMLKDTVGLTIADSKQLQETLASAKPSHGALLFVHTG